MNEPGGAGRPVMPHHHEYDAARLRRMMLSSDEYLSVVAATGDDPYATLTSGQLSALLDAGLLTNCDACGWWADRSHRCPSPTGALDADLLSPLSVTPWAWIEGLTRLDDAVIEDEPWISDSVIHGSRVTGRSEVSAATVDSDSEVRNSVVHSSVVHSSRLTDSHLTGSHVTGTSAHASICIDSVLTHGNLAAAHLSDTTAHHCDVNQATIAHTDAGEYCVVRGADTVVRGAVDVFTDPHHPMTHRVTLEPGVQVFDGAKIVATHHGIVVPRDATVGRDAYITSSRDVEVVHLPRHRDPLWTLYPTRRGGWQVMRGRHYHHTTLVPSAVMMRLRRAVAHSRHADTPPKEVSRFTGGPVEGTF